MTKLLGEPLFYILFFYGLSFLVMATLIARRTRGKRQIPLISVFQTLALFGLIHGAGEWLDWLALIRKTLGYSEVQALPYLSNFFSVASFVILVQFGLGLLAYESSRRTLIRLVPLVLAALYVVSMLGLRITDVRTMGLIGRHSFGVVGAVLAAMGMLRVASTMRILGNAGLVRGMAIAGVAFACYAVVGGLVVEPVFGVPVQLFRSLCAATIAGAVWSSLGIYDYVNVAATSEVPA